MVLERTGMRIGKPFTAGTALAVALLTIGCGKTRDASEMDPSAMAGAASSSAGSGGGSTTGGAAGVTGGSAAVSGSSGRVGQAGGTVTWDPLECHVKPVPEPSDATAAAEWALARKYCTALAKQPDCFKSGAAFAIAGCTSEQSLEACVAQVLWFHARTVPAACEDAWRADLECGAGATSVTVPPCSEIGTSGPYGPSAMCAQQNAAFSDCIGSSSTEVQVTGSYTSCSYPGVDASAPSCVVSCQLGPHLATLNCSGPDGLPKQCACAINGHAVVGSDPIFVSDCADAAAQAADGLCTSRFDCCFSYLDRDKQVCHCGDPREFGYDSCEDMIAEAQGQRLDLCPALLPDKSGEGCWPPGHCLP